MLMILSVKIGIKCDSFGGFSLKTVVIRLKTTVFRSVSSLFVTKKSAVCAACSIMALKKICGHGNYPYLCTEKSGRSSVRLEYTSGGRVVAGSNPVTPTNEKTVDNQA